MMLKDKAAIVTGGNRGIGRAIANALAKEGCNIAIAARNQKKMKEAEKELRQYGIDVLAVKCDVANSGDVKRAVRETVRKFGKIDILVNNAGVVFYKPLIETTEKEYDAMLDTNLKGTFLFTKEVLPLMAKQRSGVVVNIASGAGKHGFADLAAYCASKFAVVGFTESVAGEVSGHGVRVYAVCPGSVNTDMIRKIYPARSASSMLQPEDVAKKVLELCNPRSHVPSGAAVDVWKLF